MESQDADNLQKELKKQGKYYFLHKFPNTFYKLNTPLKIKKKISIYLKVLFKFRIFNFMLNNDNQKAKDYTATILNTTFNKLLLENSFFAVYLKQQKPSSSLTTPVNTAVVILVLGKLNQENGLPLF